MSEMLVNVEVNSNSKTSGFGRIFLRAIKVKLARRRKASAALSGQIKDYIDGSVRLFWHRQSMFISAALVAGYYYDAVIAVICFAFCQITELFDHVVASKIQAWNGKSSKKAHHFLNMLSIGTMFSAGAVAAFALLIAQQEGLSIHFTPLFFLFGAALFAAMNNHQLMRMLMVRLGIYGISFLYIPLHDIWVVRPPMNSYLWLQLATCLFVLYLIVDCSIIFLRNYQNGVQQLEELRLERDRATAAYKTKSQFVAIVSHELRTPLTSIKGGLGLIQSGSLGELPKEFRKIFGIAHKNSDRLALLIDDLLDVQKLEAGQMSYRFAELEIYDLLRESVESNEGYGKVMDVSFQFYGGLEPLFIEGDHGRLMQVMANILSNAVKFSKPGGIVKVKAERVGNMAVITVADEGIGIPPNVEDKVFGTFSQVDARDLRKVGGSGLGLSIAKQIVEGHNGEISYSSEPGQGTEFAVKFKLIDSEDDLPIG